MSTQEKTVKAEEPETCPVCLELLSAEDILSCNHKVHKKCVKEAVDATQDELVEDGYPPRKYGQCPICRAPQEDILAKPARRVGQIELNTEQMQEVLDSFAEKNYFFGADAIPECISEQLPDAHQEEVMLFANNAASMLWLSQHRTLPRKVRIRQNRGGSFGHHIIY